MHKRWPTALVALLVLSASARAVDDSPFPELVANPFEARIGSMYQFDDEKLRLDIGYSLDLYEEQGPWTQGQLSFGIDFMTWTRLRSETNFKFPVETIDYWFGVNAKYRFGTGPWHTRLRIAHISSHMVDGLADANGTITPTPFVYSREFAELIVGRHVGDVRPYAGFTAMWATQPDDPNAFIPQAGLDLRHDLSERWQLRGGYDVRLIGINGVYAASNAAQLGMALKNKNGSGFLMSLYGFSGRSMHGMFYTGYDAYLAFGVQFIW